MNPCIDPMVYPLLFPQGDFGWHAGMEHVQERRTAKRIRVTQLQYYAYRLAICNLRVELHQGLLDALQSEAHSNNVKLEKLIILPSTFQGSPRAMQQNYKDAMAIVRKFGRPDIFLTFTCNPAWPEIVSALQRHQRPENRPNIIVRVFELKLTELLDDILKRHVFGKVISFIYVIEFQKRGLPHAHMLLTLDSAKIRTKDDIDKFVSAELPNKTLNPRLHDIITKCMIHGPCGILNQNSPCMKEGLCSKNFPKDFQETTQENENGYPVYQRSITEPINVGKYDIDNRWVVPYNPWLSKKFNAHINVEICASVKSGWTLYASAPEAMWRLNEFHMFEKSHTVMRLAVHLPNQQQVIYQSGHEVEAVARASARHTTLTAWFQLNQTDVDACRYYYSDMPHYYVFDRRNNWWKRRQRGGDQIIGKMPVVSIQDSERYF
nr:uncharacterized protein LOC122270292 [Parasteatoda tepidariorum]